MLVTLVLLGPALVLGALFAFAVRRHPGIDPASPRAASAVAHELERKDAEPRSGFHMPTRLDPKTETGLLLLLALVVLVVGGVILGALGLLVRSNSSLLHIDKSVAPWGEDHMTSFAQWMLDFVTSFGSTWVIVGFTIGVFVVETIRRPSRWLPLFLITVTIGQMLMSTQIKNLLDRVRPTANPIAHTLGPSFPSGHTTGAAACFAAFALVLGRGRSRNVQSLLAGAAVFIAIAVAASRVLLGVHWLSDVIGGLALGWGWFALCSIAFGGRVLRLGAPVEAATRVSEAAAQTSESVQRDPVPRA
ncbi:MAG TPA: phosphatase PAP2 family protein [Acidimicrobiia bacterium]|nr:phosphatase PAP2 family protein [Acidimicrobiia bacterium]